MSGQKHKRIKKGAGLLLGALLLLSACGNFSNEDLIFLAAIPDVRSAQLQVPGTEDATNVQQSLSSVQQAMTVCDQWALMCDAQKVATGFNKLTFDLLTMVDNIARNHQPTRREVGRRIWGPVFLNGATLRFEMNRQTDVSDGIFGFCLHVMPGRLPLGQGRDLTCEDAEHDSGLIRILHGSFTPGEDGAEGGARQGAGSMIFEAHKLRELTGGNDIPAGQFVIDYDHRGGGREVQVHVQTAEDGGADFLRPQVDYLFDKGADGSGQFEFSIFADFVGEGIFGDHQLETLDVGLRWNTAKEGRADAQISGGNLDTVVVNATQCWDALLDTVYYEDSDERHPVVGDGADCVFADAFDFGG